MIAGPLATIAELRSSVTRSISPENPDGEPGGGGRAVDGTGARFARDLGPGWKISPSVFVPAGGVHEVARIAGPGVITHLWCTTAREHWRSLLLRAYWDGSAEPAVEVPLGDFFCNGWGEFAPVSSAVVAANPYGGFNSYWPMPFHGSARVTIENLSDDEAQVFYQLTYEQGDVAAGAAYFHAQWRRSDPLALGETHCLLADVQGQGHYAGTYLAWAALSDGWWGEGELRMFLDGDTDHPTICGTGTEDYFGGAWNFDLPGHGYTTYSTPYLGLPQVSRPDGLYRAQQRFGMYRWHIADPVRFAHGIERVDIQALGWRRRERYLQRRDDIASTAYFYLDRPVTARPDVPTMDRLDVI